MDRLTFVTEVLKSSLWPAVAIAGACAYRKELKALVSRVRKTKVGAAEIEFEEQKGQAAPASTPESPAADPLAAPVLAYTPDRRMILDAWADLNEAVSDLLRSYGIPEPLVSWWLFPRLEALEELKVLSPAETNRIRELCERKTRLAKDPGREPSIEEAVDFLCVARELMEVLAAAGASRTGQSAQAL